MPSECPTTSPRRGRGPFIEAASEPEGEVTRRQGTAASVSDNVAVSPSRRRNGWLPAEAVEQVGLDPSCSRCPRPRRRGNRRAEVLGAEATLLMPGPGASDMPHGSSVRFANSASAGNDHHVYELQRQPGVPATTRPRMTPVPTAGAGPRADVSRGGAPGIPGGPAVGADGADDVAVCANTNGGVQATATATVVRPITARTGNGMVGWDLITPRCGKENSTCPTPNISWRPCARN